MSGAALLVKALEAQGVDIVFGYPGGAIMPVYDALTSANLTHILTRHEQGAALAAEGYARASGKVGVCMATSGPGATNLVTGLADAFLDSAPVVAITGQVATPLMGTDAFQEVDIFGVTLPVVKHSFIIRDPAAIPQTVADAFRIASTGRPGPVLIDLPKDIGVATLPEPALPGPRPEPPRAGACTAMTEAEELLRAAKKPILYVGGGVQMAGAVRALRALHRRTGIPAVATLKGLGAIPTDDPGFIGMLGMHGLKAANLAVQSCDLLINVGARFDDRATGALAGFAPNARVIHLDADQAEISKLRRADVGLTGGLLANLYALDPGPLDIADWRAEVDALKTAHALRYDAPGEGVFAPKLLKDLSERAGDDLVIAADVGQHQMWVAQHCRFLRPDAHLSSGGLGTMGFGLPAAIGAKLSRPEATVVCVTGDGSIMMNIQELATLRRYAVPVKIVLLDNSMLGMVRQWQDLFFDGNRSAVDLAGNPDFAAVARAVGIEAVSVEARAEVEAGIDRLLAAEGPILMHVTIDPAENVWPLVPPGKSNADMMDGDAP
ncbi:MAG: acetolactate synthase 2 catalytic subunit [Caulobacterales bacterium]|nr:acetolactate synthase 2 catalytic subunit [Caulobacterales bacterium]